MERSLIGNAGWDDVMLRSSSIAATLLLALSATHVVAQRLPQGPLPGLGVENRPGLKPEEQEPPKSFAETEELWKDTSTSLVRILDKPCLNEADAKMVALAERAIGQLGNFLRRLPGVSGFSTNPDETQMLANKRSLDLKIGQLLRLLAQVKKIKPCAPPGGQASAPAPTETSPTGSGEPKKPSVVHLPDTSLTTPPSKPPKQKPQTPADDVPSIRETYKLSKCLTDDEVKRVWKLDREISSLEAHLNLLKKAQEYLNSGQTMHDFIQAQNGNKDITAEDEADYIRIIMNPLLNEIHANPSVIREKEESLKAKQAEFDELRNKKCPEDERTGWNGFFGGAQFATSWSHLDTTEYNADTGEPTNRLHDCCSGVGAGFHIGYDRLISERMLIGAVIDANYLNDIVKHRFPNGSSIGSTMNATASVQARAGFLIMPNLLLYGQGGASIANQELKIAFGGPRTNTSKVTPGLTIGGGVEYLLPEGVLGTSTSLFAGYEHSFWEKAKLNIPVASPFFNYRFKRNSDAIKLGVRFRFGT